MIQRILNSLKVRLLPYYNSLGGGSNIIRGFGLRYRCNNLRIYGKGNRIECYSTLGKNVRITIHGNNNHLYIGKNITYKRGSIWFEDESNIIHIGDRTTIEDASLAVAEKATKLIIGDDCMLSFNIRISTTDSHSIINLKTGYRTNFADDIIIGDHVWVGNGALINKGVNIGSNAIVGCNSVVTRSCPSSCIIAGVPAKVIKENTTWKRERTRI